jgi:mannose-6-phosphate isomerase-like protein (cupin superfamily)
MFVFTARTFLEELEMHAPDVLRPVREAVVGRRADMDFIRLEEEAFRACPSISVDHAIAARGEGRKAAASVRQAGGRGAQPDLSALGLLRKSDPGQSIPGQAPDGCAGSAAFVTRPFHRAEHWVVVQGTAHVTRDAESLIVCENESVYLPLGCLHRLENRGRIPVTLIEVQAGAYLGEDDIVRLGDVYGRA